MIQNLDASKPNYGDPAKHPERIDINARGMAQRESPAQMRRLRGLGYVGGDDEEPEDSGDDAPPARGPAEPQDGDRARGRRGGPGGPGGPNRHADWMHTNAVAYNAELDQIALSVRTFSEIWIIDHSTTTTEAASRTGGRAGRGGDLLFRWGNPRVYGAGTAKDQQLFVQHDVRWVPKGSPGAGNLLVFNNGEGRAGRPYSAVVELVPPLESSGRYSRENGKSFGPAAPAWEYAAEDRDEFYSSHISGAHRLPNGNTLICDGQQGRIFEVTGAGKIVWEYWNPYLERSGPDDMPPGPPGPPGGTPGGRGDGFRPGGRGPGGPGGLFRATRLVTDDPGIKALLKSSPRD